MRERERERVLDDVWVEVELLLRSKRMNDRVKRESETRGIEKDWFEGERVATRETDCNTLKFSIQ